MHPASLPYPRIKRPLASTARKVVVFLPLAERLVAALRAGVLVATVGMDLTVEAMAARGKNATGRAAKWGDLLHLDDFASRLCQAGPPDPGDEDGLEGEAEPEHGLRGAEGLAGGGVERDV